MSVSTLQEKFTALGTRLGTYCGAESLLSFGNTAAEFSALLEGSALVNTSWQAKLVLSGEDRVRWLNGMVTNNVRDLAPNHSLYNFALNAQGRIQGDLVVSNRGDYLLVTTGREQAAVLVEIFDRFIIMDDVEVADISDKLATLSVFGPQAADLLRTAGLDVQRLQPGELMDTVWRDLGLTVSRSVLPQVDGYELWFSAENLGKVWDILVFTGATPSGSDAFELYRIFRGVPRYGVDLRERDLPQETGQEHALNFTKGCYIGQEIVERIRARGNVHRTFIGFELTREVPEMGTKIRLADKDVGEVTSAARIPFPDGERILALGYLRREAAAPGSVLQVGAQDATVQRLPFSTGNTD